MTIYNYIISFLLVMILIWVVGCGTTIGQAKTNINESNMAIDRTIMTIEIGQIGTNDNSLGDSQ